MPVLYLLLTGAVALASALSVGYLLLLLGAAAFRRPGSAGTEQPGLRLVAVIPAHNEEPVLAAALASLQAQEYDPARLEVVVVADNCTDATARVAREYGATVLERHNREERGKGYALAWAFERLLSRPEVADAYVIVDADTWVDPGFMGSMAAELARRADRNGCCALQGRYGVLNGEESWRTELMTAALDLYNHVRPLGADRLGCSVPLKGNGMGFTRAVLERAAWSGASITEDLEYALRLLRDHGIRIGYAPAARVRAQMPVTGAQAASQRERWEQGRYALLRHHALPLLRLAARRRDLRLAEAAVGLLVPPLAELAMLLLGWLLLAAAGGATGLLPGAAAWLAGGIAGTAALGAYVLLGLRLAGASAGAYRALLRAPGYACWKLGLYVAGALRGARSGPGAGEWVRTGRTAIAVSGAQDRRIIRPRTRGGQL